MGASVAQGFGTVGPGYYVSQPSIFALHGVTGAMAVHLLSGHVEPDHAAAAFAQLEAEHRALYSDITPAAFGDPVVAGPASLVSCIPNLNLLRRNRRDG